MTGEPDMVERSGPCRGKKVRFINNDEGVHVAWYCGRKGAEFRDCQNVIPCLALSSKSDY